MNPLNRKSFVMMTLLVFFVALCAEQLFAANKPWIGIYMQDVTPDLAEAFGLSVKKGVVINDLADNSPAEKAGLKQKDVIVAWNGKSVADSDMLTELVGDSKVGDKVKLSIDRNGKEMEIALEVGERSEPRFYGRRDSEQAPKSFQWNSLKSTGIGVSLQALSGDLGEYFGVPDGNGALITQVMKDTPAQKAGLKAGDVIVKVDKEKVDSPSDVSSIIGEKKKGDKVELVVVRDKSEKTFTMEADEIESFGSMNMDMFNDPGSWMPRFHEGDMMPRIYRFDQRDQDEFQRKMEEMQSRLEEMQRKLEQLEGKMK